MLTLKEILKVAEFEQAYGGREQDTTSEPEIYSPRMGSKQKPRFRLEYRRGKNGDVRIVQIKN